MPFGTPRLIFHLIIVEDGGIHSAHNPHDASGSTPSPNTVHGWVASPLNRSALIESLTIDKDKNDNVITKAHRFVPRLFALSIGNGFRVGKLFKTVIPRHPLRFTDYPPQTSSPTTIFLKRFSRARFQSLPRFPVNDFHHRVVPDTVKINLHREIRHRNRPNNAGLVSPSEVFPPHSLSISCTTLQNQFNPMKPIIPKPQ